MDDRNPLEVQEDCWQATGAYDQPEEEQAERVREKRSMVQAIGRLFAALKPFNANPFWRSRP